MILNTLEIHGGLYGKKEDQAVRRNIVKMHPVNRLLSIIGWRLIRPAPIEAPKDTDIPAEFLMKFQSGLEKCKENRRNLDVFTDFYYEIGHHPSSYIDAECTFAAQHLAKTKAKTILDIGSYRHFVLGLLAHFEVTTIDVRDRDRVSNNETIITCDAKSLNIPDNSFDAVVSLCAVEHFGLGRYGDDFDLDADIKAFHEMIRVLKPGGLLIFSTTLTNTRPAIAFNAHRIYTYSMIRDLCENLENEESQYYSRAVGGTCSLEEVTKMPGDWDVYLGCWTKK
jgi:SAM-dependent methyltransferase